MKRNALYVCITTTLFLLAACSPAAEPEPAPAADSTTADNASDPLSGTWSGDWGPSASDRNSVMLDLQWDGTNLTGTVNPGPNAVQLSAASFNRDTGAIMMEADAQGRGGATFHYTIAGTVEGNMMSGSWSHDNVEGDFRLTKD